MYRLNTNCWRNHKYLQCTHKIIAETFFAFIWAHITEINKRTSLRQFQMISLHLGYELTWSCHKEVIKLIAWSDTIKAVGAGVTKTVLCNDIITLRDIVRVHRALSSDFKSILLLCHYCVIIVCEMLFIRACSKTMFHICRNNTPDVGTSSCVIDMQRGLTYYTQAQRKPDRQTEHGPEHESDVFGMTIM